MILQTLVFPRYNLVHSFEIPTMTHAKGNFGKKKTTSSKKKLNFNNRVFL